jgi:hypothetical protein
VAQDTDDAWKDAHMAILAERGKDAWCGATGLMERHVLDMTTPLLTARSARCADRRGQTNRWAPVLGGEPTPRRDDACPRTGILLTSQLNFPSQLRQLVAIAPT